jgi:RHS repeat-associated protein
VSQTRTHAAAHELTGLTTGGTTSPLSYDPKGNLLSRPAALASPALGLVWDFDNRLRGADTNGTPASQEVSFEYDALGRRVARSETGNNVVYIHAGQQVIADYARGAAAAAPSFRYVYGSYVDEPLLRHAGTGTTLPTSGTAALYYHRNQQYSIVGLSDAAGTLVERYAYTAYGELTILAPDRTLRATSSFQNRYTYTGREWDAGLSLYYFRARWLDPKAGRFIGRDPLGYVDGMGLYGAYFAVRVTDPSGLSCKEEKKCEIEAEARELLMGIIEARMARYAVRFGATQIWKRGLAQAGALAIGDGPFPAGEIIGIGNLFWTAVSVYQNGAILDDLVKFFNESFDEAIDKLLESVSDFVSCANFGEKCCDKVKEAIGKLGNELNIINPLGFPNAAARKIRLKDGLKRIFAKLVKELPECCVDAKLPPGMWKSSKGWHKKRMNGNKTAWVDPEGRIWTEGPAHGQKRDGKPTTFEFDVQLKDGSHINCDCFTGMQIPKQGNK